MKNCLAALFFIVIAFATGLSIAFNLCSLFGREEDFFKTKRSAITIYAIAIVFAILFTIVSYGSVRIVQRMI